MMEYSYGSTFSFFKDKRKKNKKLGKKNCIFFDFKNIFLDKL